MLNEFIHHTATNVFVQRLSEFFSRVAAIHAATVPVDEDAEKEDENIVLGSLPTMKSNFVVE